MDQDLERMRRDVEAAPADADAARRYEQALLRAGKRDEAKARYRFKFQCPKRWEELGVQFDLCVDHRRCGDCDRRVEFVATPEELAAQIRAGTCVASQPAVIGAALELLLDDAELNPARGEQEPCLMDYLGPIPPRPILQTFYGSEPLRRGLIGRILSWIGGTSHG